MAMMTRAQAKLIAEELYKLLRNDVVSATKEIASEDMDQYMSAPEAASMLGWTVKTLYARKNDIGSYTKVGRKLMFRRSQLMKIIDSGKLKRRESCIMKGEYPACV